MESLVSEISCSIYSNQPHITSSNFTNIALASSPHVIPSSRPSASSTPPTALLKSDNTKSTASPLLPLPPSRPLFPSPLKFLWFGKDDPSDLPSKSSDSSPEPSSQVAESDPEDPSGILDPKPCTCVVDFEAHASNADQLIAINDINCSKETHEVSDQTLRMDSSPQLKPDKCLSSRSTSPSDSERNWISRILQFRLLWNASDPEPESSRELVESTLLIAAKGGNQALKVEKADSSDDEEVDDSITDGNCALSSENEQRVCMLESSHERVVHDRQSVSPFLHEVPVTEVQAISKLCVLSNLAYIVPEVQSKDLLKEHHLSFVTSSVVKKEETEAKAALEKSMAHASTQKNIGRKRRLKTQEETAVLKKALCDAEYLGNVSSPGQILMCAEATLKEDGIPNATLQVQVVEAVNEEITNLEETTGKAAKEDTLKVLGSCPCEWFICDDEATSTRYLAIQGSDSLASWQTNLSFDPTEFEGLGVLVHRGVYEAARALYNMVVEEIVEHTRTGPHARVCFTGHSLGGSLAMLLAMMLVKRGVVRASAVEGVVTLGAACVLCSGEGLLTQLGLQERQFVHVVMHRDIVPRAFACDYPDHVARLLKRLNGAFRDHPCLNYQRRLYAPVGQVMILQPDAEQSPGHSLLPSKNAGLYLIKHPQGQADKKTTSAAALETRDAQRAFFNMPHPLQMLRDPAAYGFEGAISRDHDPRSYRRAINTVVAQALIQARRLTLAQPSKRTHLLNPPLPSPSIPLPSPSPILLPRLAPSPSSLSPSSPLRKKHVLHHHSSRLLASQHIHMGLLIILSLTTNLFSSFLSWV